MPDSPDGESPLTRRRALGLTGAGITGGLLWDVFRSGSDVDVTGPAAGTDATEAERAAYVRGCTGFGFDLLSELATDRPGADLMVSPLGLSAALAMTWAGAAGDTQQRMRETVRFPHGQDRLHSAVGDAWAR